MLKRSTPLLSFRRRRFAPRSPYRANALVGTYDIDVKLFSKGDLVAHSQSAFEVVKTGVVQFIAAAARNYGLLYGFAVTMMALAMGWIAYIVFQRE